VMLPNKLIERARAHTGSQRSFFFNLLFTGVVK